MADDGKALKEYVAPFGIEVVKELIPHRDPFLLVDRVETMTAGESIVAFRLVREDDPWFRGHFPGNPLMPGVLMIEAIAQAGAVMALSHPNLRGKLAVLGGINKCRIRRMVVPGDELRLEARTLYFRMGAGKIVGSCSVGGKMAAEATISFMVLEPDEA